MFINKHKFLHTFCWYSQTCVKMTGQNAALERAGRWRECRTNCFEALVTEKNTADSTRKRHILWAGALGWRHAGDCVYLWHRWSCPLLPPRTGVWQRQDGNRTCSVSDIFQPTSSRTQSFKFCNICVVYVKPNKTCTWKERKGRYLLPSFNLNKENDKVLKVYLM